MRERVIVLLMAAGFGLAADSSTCSPCHAEIARAYAKTGMAQSFSRITPQLSTAATYDHQASGIHYEMRANGGAYFQRQQLGAAEPFDSQVDYVLGSGNHARTFLHRKADGTLIQLPLGWYAEAGGTWAMNPGYDRPDHQGLSRRITYDCMFCHNAYPTIPPDTMPRSAPVYLKIPEGIDCQRCHGDGARHIASKGSVKMVTKESCEQCHLETTSSPLPASIVRYERGPFSYQPGEPLENFILHFDRAGDHSNRFEITGSVYRLRQSQCFLQSAGKLTCTTCHNPHEALTPTVAKVRVANACRQCHTAPHDKSDRCVDCHMPKRRTDDVVHVVMTDHRIQRRPPAGDLLAPRAETPVDANPYRGEVIPYGASVEIYTAIAQVTQQSNSAVGIVRLQAAVESEHPQHAEYSLQLGDSLATENQCKAAIPMYELAVKFAPKSAEALERLALCYRATQQYPEAEAALARALQLHPTDAAWIQMASVRLNQGKIREAIAALENADSPDALNMIGGIQFEIGQWKLAEAPLRQALREQPNYAEAHNNLGNVLSMTDRFDEAKAHFEAALRYKKNYDGARYNYALALVKVKRLDEAQSQLEAILRHDPNSAGTHELLGNVFGAKGQRDGAMQEFREALRSEPDFARANLSLAQALIDAGDHAAAIPYLQKAAAQSSDSNTRDQARKLLCGAGRQAC